MSSAINNASEGAGTATRFLTTEEVAALVRAPAATVRYWVHAGIGPKSFKIGRRRLYAAEDVEAFIEAAKSGPGAA